MLILNKCAYIDILFMILYSMSKKRLYFFSGIILFFTFILFSWIVHKNVLHNFDFNMTVRLQDHIPRRLDEPFSLLSLIGSFEITGSMLVIIILFFMFIQKKLSGIFVLFAFGLFHVMELYGKAFVRHLPPPHFMLRTQLPFNFPEFYVRTENSYPSGHAARAFFLTTVLFIIVWKSKKISQTQKMIIFGLLAFYDIAMITSRIYLGEHWTTDVVGGTLAGMGLALMSGAFL